MLKTSFHSLIIAIICTVILACGAGGGGSSGNPTPSPTVTGTATPSITATPASTPTGSPTLTVSPTASVSPNPTPSVSPTSTPEPVDLATTRLDCGAETGDVIDNRLDASAKAYLLCKHNEGRSQVALGEYMGVSGFLPVATNMTRLRWDSNLEEVAQNWANTCTWQHNTNRGDQYNALSPTDIDDDPVTESIPIGENLAYRASSGLSSASFSYAVLGYDAWEDEGLNYSFGALNVNDFCGEEPCGHFTQAIWATSYKVGCAVNFCEADTLSFLPSTFLVCNYASAGNYSNQEPYETGNNITEVCSTATGSQTVCRNGLTQAENYNDGLD